MKRKRLILFIAVLAALAFSPCMANAAPAPAVQISVVAPLMPASADGTVYIATWEQFKNIGNTKFCPVCTMEADYVLSADIVADDSPFAPIGTEASPFYGTFDGNGHSIDVSANPTIDPRGEYGGLFGVVAQKTAQPLMMGEISMETE